MELYQHVPLISFKYDCAVSATWDQYTVVISKSMPQDHVVRMRMRPHSKVCLLHTSRPFADLHLRAYRAHHEPPSMALFDQHVANLVVSSLVRAPLQRAMKLTSKLLFVRICPAAASGHSDTAEESFYSVACIDSGKDVFVLQPVVASRK